MVLTTPHDAFIDSGVTVHVIKNVSVITRKRVSSHISTGMPGRDMIIEMAHGESVAKPSGREKPGTLTCMLYMPDVEHSLIFQSSLCGDEHTVDFSSSKWVVKKKNCVVCVCERASGMCSINLQRVSNEASVTLDVIGDTLSFWH